MLDIIEDIRGTVKRLETTGKSQKEEPVPQGGNDARGFSAGVEELRAMEVTARAIIIYAGRYAEVLEKMAADSASRRDELLELARICRKVPAHKPDTFHEALQYYWFVHLGVITELNPWTALTRAGWTNTCCLIIKKKWPMVAFQRKEPGNCCSRSGLSSTIIHHHQK